MLGYAFMGRAHTNAPRALAYVTWPLPADVRLVSIAGRNGSAVKEAVERFGFEQSGTDWRAIVENPSVQLFDNVGPNSLHAEPTIAAARAGKHVICERPPARSAARRDLRGRLPCGRGMRCDRALGCLRQPRDD